MEKFAKVFALILGLLCLLAIVSKNCKYTVEAKVLGVYCDGSVYAETVDGETFCFTHEGFEQGESIKMTLWDGFTKDNVTDDKILCVEIL